MQKNQMSRIKSSNVQWTYSLYFLHTSQTGSAEKSSNSSRIYFSLQLSVIITMHNIGTVDFIYFTGSYHIHPFPTACIAFGRKGEIDKTAKCVCIKLFWNSNRFLLLMLLSSSHDSFWCWAKWKIEGKSAYRAWLNTICFACLLSLSSFYPNLFGWLTVLLVEFNSY